MKRPSKRKTLLIQRHQATRTTENRLAMRTGTWQHPAQVEIRAGQLGLVEGLFSGACVQRILGLRRRLQPEAGQQHIGRIDRKSTRLNSSHVKISYAVFCLKKKKY